MHKQQGWPQAWEYCQEKPIQTLGRASQGVNWSWSQCIKSHHAQTSSGKGLPSHFWNRNNIRSILPGLRRKRTGLLLSEWSESSFQIKVHFVFNLEIKLWSLEEDWRGTESKLLKVQCEVFEVSDDLGCHDFFTISFFLSALVYIKQSLLMSSFYWQKYCHPWVCNFIINNRNQYLKLSLFFCLSCKVGEMSLVRLYTM